MWRSYRGPDAAVNCHRFCPVGDMLDHEPARTPSVDTIAVYRHGSVESVIGFPRNSSLGDIDEVLTSSFKGSAAVARSRHTSVDALGLMRIHSSPSIHAQSISSQSISNQGSETKSPATSVAHTESCRSSGETDSVADHLENISVL